MGDKKDVAAAEVETASVPAKKEKEAASFVVPNPSRITPQQVKYITLMEDVSVSYIPIRCKLPGSSPTTPVGIVILASVDPTKVDENVTKGK